MGTEIFLLREDIEGFEGPEDKCALEAVKELPNCGTVLNCGFESETGDRENISLRSDWPLS